MYAFVAKHPVYMNKADKLEKADQYCRKVYSVLRGCEMESADDEQIAMRVMAKLTKLLTF